MGLTHTPLGSRFAAGAAMLWPELSPSGGEIASLRAGIVLDPSCRHIVKVRYIYLNTREDAAQLCTLCWYTCRKRRTCLLTSGSWTPSQRSFNVAQLYRSVKSTVWSCINFRHLQEDSVTNSPSFRVNRTGCAAAGSGSMCL